VTEQKAQLNDLRKRVESASNLMPVLDRIAYQSALFY